MRPRHDRAALAACGGGPDRAGRGRPGEKRAALDHRARRLGAGSRRPGRGRHAGGDRISGRGRAAGGAHRSPDPRRRPGHHRRPDRHPRRPGTAGSCRDPGRTGPPHHRQRNQPGHRGSPRPRCPGRRGGRMGPHPPRRRMPGLQPGRSDRPPGYRTAAAGPSARCRRRLGRHRSPSRNPAVLLPGEAVTAPRVLLLVPARTYRAADFLTAAGRLGLDLVVGSDGALPLGGHPVVLVSPGDPERIADRIMARTGPVAAVVAADTPMLILAAVIAGRMGLPHNPVDAVTAACDKVAQRRRWAAAQVAQPAFQVVAAAAAEDAVRQAAAEVGWPCVVKAASLSASQGVLRADDPAAAVAAARRIRRVLATAGRPPHEPLLVEEYVPGPELSIDGLLAGGALTVTAVFDKPWTPEGPTFEETLLITPSRLQIGRA